MQYSVLFPGAVTISDEANVNFGDVVLVNNFL